MMTAPMSQFLSCRFLYCKRSFRKLSNIPEYTFMIPCGWRVILLELLEHTREPRLFVIHHFL
ncbi:unnamed protein product [Phytomonas sp. Hart1]|nr:unnamed protein product [Phytomonas sp. Hart1]|eukprot:CCW68720.1 unnamed protein product [Phytomonas sp. isolate Hart1]